MPYTAALSDIFGRPICLLVSLCLFTIGSIICCVAPKLAVLLAGRCVQGIGGGGILILGLVIFTDIVPLRYRPQYYGFMYATCILIDLKSLLISLQSGCLGTRNMHRTHHRWRIRATHYLAMGLLLDVPLLLLRLRDHSVCAYA